MQSLVGVLNFAQACLYEGRLFFSRILNFLKEITEKGRHKIPKSLQQDIAWWRKFMIEYNGVSMIQAGNWDRPDSQILTDSSLLGIGGYHHGRYFSLELTSEIKTVAELINECKLYAIVIACRLWLPLLKGKNILLYCDNQSTGRIVNTGRSGVPFP